MGAGEFAEPRESSGQRHEVPVRTRFGSWAKTRGAGQSHEVRVRAGALGAGQDKGPPNSHSIGFVKYSINLCKGQGQHGGASECHTKVTHTSRPTQVHNLGVHLACLCIVWAKYIDLVPLANADPPCRHVIHYAYGYSNRSGWALTPCTTPETGNARQQARR